eukprot:COSAG01_NODE_6764_length_3509_cov_25.877419_3_plen_96_part_00
MLTSMQPGDINTLDALPAMISPPTSGQRGMAARAALPPPGQASGGAPMSDGHVGLYAEGSREVVDTGGAIHQGPWVKEGTWEEQENGEPLYLPPL